MFLLPLEYWVLRFLLERLRTMPLVRTVSYFALKSVKPTWSNLSSSRRCPSGKRMRQPRLWYYRRMGQLEMGLWCSRHHGWDNLRRRHHVHPHSPNTLSCPRKLEV